MTYKVTRHIVRTAVKDVEAIRKHKAELEEAGEPYEPLKETPYKTIETPMFKVQHEGTGWETFGSYTTEAAAEKVRAELEVSKPDSTYAAVRPTDLCLSTREKKRRLLEEVRAEVASS